MSKIVPFFFCFISCFSLVSNAQDYTWWNTKNNWDGYTPWEHYLIISPKYLGPNALPVLPMSIGKLKENIELEIGGAAHFGKGDNTQNAFFNLYCPFGDRAAFEVYLVPIEFYKMDTLTRDERHIRDYDGKGNAGGDFYVQTYFQIVKERENRMGLQLRAGIKTASGTNFEAGRYTDAPGYFFDISSGKRIFSSANLSLRTYAMIGFYSFQTYDEQHKQDDAFTYGLGLNLKYKWLEIDEQLTGYNGYIYNGDKPLVNRLSLTTNSDRLLNGKFTFQYGIFDYPYTSVVLSALLNLDRLKRK